MQNLKGKIIVIEGTDGSGKQTQTKMLKERLEKEGHEVYTTSFPNYESNSSAAVKMYLNSEIAQNADEISSKAAASFYGIDRYITFKKEFEKIYKEKKKIIIFDRYVASNIIHQGAKYIKNRAQDEKALACFIDWVYNFEHNDLGIPKADITIYLNVPVEMTTKLREKRLNKITGKQKQDIHETDKSHLVNASKTGLMAAKMLGWNIINCIKDDNIRTIKDIHDEIYRTISNLSLGGK